MKNELLKYLAELDDLLSNFGIKKYDYVYEIEYENIKEMIKNNVLTFRAAIIMIDNFRKTSITKEIIYLTTDEIFNPHQEYIDKLEKIRISYASDCR